MQEGSVFVRFDWPQGPKQLIALSHSCVFLRAHRPLATRGLFLCLSPSFRIGLVAMFSTRQVGCAVLPLESRRAEGLGLSIPTAAGTHGEPQLIRQLVAAGFGRSAFCATVILLLSAQTLRKQSIDVLATALCSSDPSLAENSLE